MTLPVYACAPPTEGACGGSACCGVCHKENADAMPVLWVAVSARQEVVLYEKRGERTLALLEAQSRLATEMPHKIAVMLEDAFHLRRFQGLVLVGSKEAIARLRSRLSERLQRQVMAEIERSVEASRPAALMQELGGLMGF